MSDDWDLAPDRRKRARSPWLLWSLSVLSAADTMPVDPALAGLLPQDRSFGLHGPALADIDFHSRASSDFAPDILSESGTTDFVEGLVRLEAEAASDAFLLDFGGAADVRLDAAEPPELTLVWESGGLVLLPVKAGSVWSARAAAFAWCDMGCDHAPWDHLAAWQLPGPRRSPGNDAEPAAADIPAVDADVDSGELIATQRPQVLVMYDAATAARWGRAPASRRAAIKTSAGVRTRVLVVDLDQFAACGRA
jgi:hypothetical protein